MSTNNETRLLRMERLESRAMLAGGILDFTSSSNQSDQDRDGPQNRNLHPAEVRGHSQRHDQWSSGPGRESRDTDQRRGPRPNFSPPQSTATPQELQPVTTLSSPIQRSDTGSPSNVFALPPRVASPIGTPDTSVLRLPATDSANPTSTNTSSLSGPSSGSDVEITPSEDNSKISTLRNDQRPIATTFDRPKIAQSDRRDSSTDFDPESANDGLIEWTPLSKFNLPEDRLKDAAEPWRLESDTLPRLRELIEAQPAARVRRTDRVMSDWINGTGGMIALDQVTLPQAKVMIDSASIRVQLESHATLHRSLELIAAGTASPVDGSTIDAIMASLEQAMDSETQPVASSRSPQIPVAAYPVIAAITTGIAVSARRKNKHPSGDLLSTRQH